MKRWTACIAAVACVFTSVSWSHAAYTLAFDSEAYEVVPGGTVDVKLLLINTTPSSTGTLEAEGLQSGGGRVLDNGGDATLTLASILVGTGFSTTSSTYYPPSAFPVADPANLAGVLANNDSFTTGVGIGQDSVVIATFSFVVTGGVGDIALFLPAELNASPTFAENVSFDTGSSLDAELDNAYAQSTITVVPEPTALAFLGSAALLLLGRRRSQP